MRFVRFSERGSGCRHGVLLKESIAEIEDAPPGGICDWLERGTDVLHEIGARALSKAVLRPLRAVRLHAPIARPEKFLGLGGNYSSHLREVEHLGIKPPEVQVWFNKQVTCINGPFDDVVIPALSKAVDYEGELAVVIGRRCRNVSESHAAGVIAGFMVCNDVSARDVQLRAQTMTLGKSFDTHGPVGPCLVTVDEIRDPHALQIRTWVNDELRQDASTAEMRYSIGAQIAELSSIFTLSPGDILATGTPAGVGAAMRPPRFLRPDDVVRIEIAGVGHIENRFIAEPLRS